MMTRLSERMQRLLVLAATLWAVSALAQTPPPADGSRDYRLNDGQVAAVLMALTEAERDAAQLALEQARQPQVRAMAEQVLQEQAQLEQQLTAAAADVAGQPLESQVLLQLQEARAQQQHMLAGLPPEHFDRGYVEDRLRSQEYALELIEEELLPAAEHRHLQRVMTDMHATLAARRDSVDQLQAQLEAEPVAGAQR